MIDGGFIKKAKSAIYTFPAFFQSKPNGDLQLLFKAKYLNQHLARRAVLIPTIDELIYRITKRKRKAKKEVLWLTLLDDTGSYN